MYGNSLFRRVVSSNVRYYKANSTKKLLEFLADMPKANSARILESQRQRQHIAKKAQKYGPSTVYLQVLGSGARGAPNTLYLFTDQKRYLFNCGECTQRLAHEHKVKLSRLDHIFITSKTWRNIGGLPGLSLTLQDVGVPHITLHGPEGLDEIYTATKRFVIMNNMNVTMAKCSPNEDFEDNVMSVKYVILSKETDELLMEDLKPPTKKQRVSEPIEKDLEVFMHDNTDYYKSDVRASHAHSSEQRKQSTKPDSKEKKSPSYSPPRSPKRVEKPLLDKKREDCTVSYICTLKKRLGTLDLAKCVEMGVKPGPMLGMLKNGQDVVLSDGTLVLSKDVKTPDDPGPVFIVLDVPHISYLKPTEFRQNFANAINPPENIPTLIVHFTPPEVFHDTRYQEFLALFGPTTRHLIINGQNSCLGSESVHKTQHKLHLLDNDIFPILKDVSVPAVWNAHPPVPKSNSPLRLKGMEELKNKIAFAQFQNIIHMDGDSQQKPSEDDTAQLQLIAGRTLTMFHLRPKKQLDRSAEPKLHIQQYLQETMDVDGFVGSLEQFRRLVDSMRYKSGKQQEYPKVVFLGTGSCIPSKTRNTSAIAVQIDESRSMLLDCGEGTFCQLVRFYGPKRVNAFLRTLKAIYISHLHADHHIGLIGVLQARRQAFEELNSETPPEPCYLLAPGQIMCWLTMYDQRFERIRADFTLIPNQNLLLDRQKPSSDLTAATLAHIGLDRVATCLVPHCPNAFGVVVEIGEHKITYSGDTLPCETLVSLGYNSTLLIHEATMEDELADEARMKMHSTTTQAIEIGKAMNARYTVLTHFSQRYARLPRLNANILNDNKSIGIAFDNMQITMSDLQLLPHMYAPLQLMFAEHCLELELKAANRARQKGSTGASSQSGYTSPGSPFQYRSPGVSSPHTDRSTISDSSTSREMRAIEKKLRRALSPLALARSVSDTKCKINNNISVAESKCSELSAASLNLSADSEHFSEGLVNLKAPRTASYVSEMSKESKSGVSDIQTSPTKNRMILAEDKHYERQKQAEKMYEKSSISVFDNITKCYAKSLVSPVAHTPRELSMRRRDIVSPTDRTKSIPKTPASVIKDTVKPYKISGEKCVKNYVSRIPTKRPTDSASKLRATNTTVPISRDLSRDTRRSPKKEVTRASSISNKYIPSALHSTRQSSFTVYNASPEKSRSSSLHRTKIETSLKSSGLRQPQIQITRNYLQKLDNMGREYNMGRVGREYNLNREYNIGREYNMGQEHKPTTIGNYLDSKTKQKISTFGRPGFRVYSNRSFKPQLEDIKSSYLLLNNKKSRETNASKLLDVLKPRPLNEDERRQKLQQAKQQFQSKQFWHDSKYEKIEGLNWISWK